MIAISEEDCGLFASYNNELDRPVRVEISSFMAIKDATSTLLKPIFRYIERTAIRSRVNYLRTVALFGRILVQIGKTELPTSELGWQQLVLDVQHAVIKDRSSKATLKTRIVDTLGTINCFFKHLQEEGLIPIGVEIPSYKNFEKIEYSSHLKSLIGTASPQVVSSIQDKLLCSISLARSDAAYLDEVYVELSNKRQFLRDVLLRYFRALVQHAKWGRDAISSTDAEEVLQRMHDYGDRVNELGKFHRNGQHYCALSVEEGLKRYLSVANHLHSDLPPDKSGVLPRVSRDKDLFASGLMSPFEVDDTTSDYGPVKTIRLRWMLGIITDRDVAVLTALLILDHPRFTPESVTSARLIGPTGKMNLVLGDSSETFEVIKGRAKSVKREHLSEVGQEIFHFLVEVSQHKREHLRLHKNPICDLLFLCKNERKGSIVAPNHMNCVGYLSGRKGPKETPWLGSFFPSLIGSGLDRGTITFKKIRNTEGVLEWFRSGNLDSVSKKLGNKTRTVISNYIPPSLLAAWNTRLIRRFQNLWISVAAANEPFLFEVTDFQSLSDLHHFIEQMIESHELGTSPLVDRLHEAFRPYENSAVSMAGNSSLSISISKPTLTMLYTYCDAALDAGISEIALNRPDPIYSICPQHFLDLAILLRHSLPTHDHPDFRGAHMAAEEAASRNRGRINWPKLFIEKQGEQQ